MTSSDSGYVGQAAETPSDVPQMHVDHQGQHTNAGSPPASTSKGSGGPTKNAGNKSAASTPNTYAGKSPTSTSSKAGSQPASQPSQSVTLTPEQLADLVSKAVEQGVKDAMKNRQDQAPPPQVDPFGEILTAAYELRRKGPKTHVPLDEFINHLKQARHKLDDLAAEHTMIPVEKVEELHESWSTLNDHIAETPPEEADERLKWIRALDDLDKVLSSNRAKLRALSER